MIGLGTSITDVAEFNRRAACALKGVTFLPGSWDKRFARDMREAIEAGRDLTDKQQQALYNVVHRYRRQIIDRLVTEYAAMRAKGAD